MIFDELYYHWDVRMSDTIRPYKAKASPKMRIKIIPTNIFSCWAFARTPASPTMPIDNPAAFITTIVPANWSRSTIRMPNGHKRICRCKCLRLHQQKCTSLDNNDSHDHTIDTQDTGHDNGDDWLHDELWLEDTHGANSDSGFGWSVGSSQVCEDECGGNSDVSKEILRSFSWHVDWFDDMKYYDWT